MFETIRQVPALKVARIVALSATVLAAILHAAFGLHAGALWRDEVTSVEIATMQTWGETWSNLAFESFPALFVALLRIVAGVPASASDAQLRLFGVVIGLLILAVLWLSARWLRFGVPLLSLALIGFNPMVIRYGDSIRAYGLGILLMLLALGAMWRLMESFTPGRIALAAATALLSVQCLYYNAVFLGAVCLGAVAITLRRRDFKRATVVLAIGALAALSLVPYLPTIQRVKAWSFIWKTPFTPSSVWLKLSETFGSPISAGVWVWICLFAFALLAGGWALFQKPIEDRALFALVTLVAGTFAYAGFLKILSYLTQPWYYIVFLAFAAVCIEMLLASISTSRALLGRAAFALLFCGVAIYPAFATVKVRQTNIDLVAAQLESRGAEGDLILINPFPYGISFRYYYSGRAAYRTIPPIADLRSHRADMLKAQMMATAPMAPLLQEIEVTLRGGRTVWLVGGVDFVAPGQIPRVVAPGYDGAEGWEGGDFYRAWSEQTGFLLRTHAEQVERIKVPVTQPVIHYENVPLSAFRGWRSTEVQ